MVSYMRGQSRPSGSLLADRQPGWAGFFPLVVSQLLDLGAVRFHHEYFAVRLGRFGVKGFVLESHARCCKQQVFAVRRPSQVRVIAVGMRELRQGRSVRMDGEDLEIANAV